MLHNGNADQVSVLITDAVKVKLTDAEGSKSESEAEK